MDDPISINMKSHIFCASGADWDMEALDANTSTNIRASLNRGRALREHRLYGPNKPLAPPEWWSGRCQSLCSAPI